MNQAIAVEKYENIEHGFQHFASFGSGERTLGENLGEVFFGMFHHDVETIRVRQAPAAAVEDAQQIGMSELHGAAPKREMELGGRAGGNEFDGGLLRWCSGELREEHGGVIRSAQVLLQPEFIVDDLTFALFPDIAHIAPPTGNSCEPANGDTPNCLARDRGKSAAASEAGLECLDLRRLGPGPHRPHSGMK